MSLVGGFFNWGILARYRDGAMPYQDERVMGTWQPNHETYANLNHAYLIHDSWITGREAYDYTNINAFTIGQLDAPGLKAHYGLIGDTPSNVNANVQATPRLRVGTHADGVP